MRPNGTTTPAYEDSIWRTWKPYAGIAAALAGAMWWYTSQSSFATLKDGDYTCMAVSIDVNGKYVALVDSEGNPYQGSATVRAGAVVDMTGNTPLPPDQQASPRPRQKGTSHFHVRYSRTPLGYEPAGYFAAACDYAGGSAE